MNGRAEPPLSATAIWRLSPKWRVLNFRIVGQRLAGKAIHRSPYRECGMHHLTMQIRSMSNGLSEGTVSLTSTCWRFGVIFNQGTDPRAEAPPMPRTQG